MTEPEFIAFYPQFAGFTPAFVLSGYLRQANARFTAFTEEDAEEARRLYTAHKLTLYARSALPDEPPAAARNSYARLAAAGQVKPRLAGKKAGEVAVTYASGASPSVSAVSAGLADLTETDFGLQLLSLVRLYSRSVYVP